MTLDPRRTALWRAMGLGPQWLPRERVADSTVTGVAEAADAVPALDGGATDHRGAAAVGEPPARIATPAPAVTGDRSAIATLDWDALRSTVAGCTACGLCKTRKQTVFGVGHPQAHWMIVGEAPGAEEDARGEPFVGQAGRLLDSMLAAIGLARDAQQAAQAVYIANVLKCRPPGNRNPEPAEVAQCDPFLKRQVELVNPRLILVMGRFAAQSLLGTEASIASLRGRVHQIEVAGRKRPVVVTYHPAYLLRNLADKSKSWADLCLARRVAAGH